MMRPFLMLRSVAWLKRTALALEDISDSLAILAERAPRPKKAKRTQMAQVFNPTVEEMNEAWREEHGR